MYAIKVPFDDSMLYVIDVRPGSDELKPRTFDTIEEAEDHATLWGDKAIVVEYREE